MTMTQGITAGEAYRAAAVLNDRGHGGRRDWYVGEGDEGRVVTSPGGAEGGEGMRDRETPKGEASHGELVAVAERWLRRAERCGVVLTECDGTTAEVPDAIGWKCWGNLSILVECKASRADFLADRRKPFRQVGGLGVGRFRYYLAPAGLLRAADIPPGWGWLEWTGARVMRRRRAVRRENNLFAENTMMARRLKLYQRVERGQGLNPTRSGRAVMADLDRKEADRG